MAAIAGQPGPKPSNLSAPVPSAPQPQMDFSPDEMKQLKGLSADVSPDEQAQLARATGQAPEQPGLGAQALDYGTRALDYPGGGVRTGLAEVAGLATGQPNVVTPEDLKNAAKGKAPNSAEYLRRLGVPEGGSLDLPGFGRVTTRGAAGMAADIATDPLTLVAKFAKEIPYVGKLLNVPGAAMDALGEAVYKSAVGSTDAHLASKGLIEAGETPVGDALLASGAPVGNAKTLADKVNDISSIMGKIRQGMYDKVNQAGAMIDVGLASGGSVLPKAEAALAPMRRNPNMRPAADALENMMNLFKNEGRVSIEQLSEWKTQLYNSMPAVSFDAFGKLKGEADAFKGALAADFRNLIVDTGNHVEKGLGDAINALNEKWAPLLDAAKPMNKIAAKGAGGGNLGTIVDGVLLATGGVSKLAVKKGYDIAMSPLAKTAVGKALMFAGQQGIGTGLANRMMINQQNAPAAPPMAGPVAPQAPQQAQPQDEE